MDAPSALWPLQSSAREGPAFFGGVGGLLNGEAEIGAAFLSAFGFFNSRVLRFWPLAMATSIGCRAPGPRRRYRRTLSAAPTIDAADILTRARTSNR